MSDNSEKDTLYAEKATSNSEKDTDASGPVQGPEVAPKGRKRWL